MRTPLFLSAACTPLGQHTQHGGADTRKRPGPDQQLAATRPVDAPLRVGAVERHAKPGTRLVGDRVERQQRLAHPPVATFLQRVVERRVRALAKRAPLLGQGSRDRSPPVLDPSAPFAARLFDFTRPVRIAARRPLPYRREAEPKRLRLGKDGVREREQVRRPLQELVGDGGAGDCMPRGCGRTRRGGSMRRSPADCVSAHRRSRYRVRSGAGRRSSPPHPSAPAGSRESCSSDQRHVSGGARKHSAAAARTAPSRSMRTSRARVWAFTLAFACVKGALSFPNEAVACLAARTAVAPSRPLVVARPISPGQPRRNRAHCGPSLLLWRSLGDSSDYATGAPTIRGARSEHGSRSWSRA